MENEGEMRIAIDFGSTYTKLVAFDCENGTLLASAYTPTTQDDVRIGLRHGLVALQSRIGDLSRATYLACSSAKGGLRIVVIGLVPALSLAAATQAALGAGGKVVAAFGRRLGESDLARVRDAAPDLILLAGGTDGGDESTIEHNARMLAQLGAQCPVIVAGNMSAADRCRDILVEAACEVVLAPNILPDVAKVDPEGVREAIRDLFTSRIVQAKGIDRIEEVVSPLKGSVIPTPVAIQEAAELLAGGPRGLGGGFGEVILVDVGGATTDVYSVARGDPMGPDVLVKGLPEPLVKRTVEGDLGLRESIRAVIDDGRDNTIATWAQGLGGVENLGLFVDRCVERHDYVPSSESEFALDAALARAAVGVASRRHVGSLEEAWVGSGRVLILRGKDLRRVRHVVGIGGVLVRGHWPRFVLEGALATGADDALLPNCAQLWIDSNYLLFGVGLLARDEPELAFRIAKRYIELLDQLHESLEVS